MNHQLAIQMLGQFSKSFDIWAMMGPARAKKRQELMTLLVGKKLPVAKCGVTAIREEFWMIAGVTDKGDCIAARDDLFAEWCRQNIAEIIQ